MVPRSKTVDRSFTTAAPLLYAYKESLVLHAAAWLSFFQMRMLTPLMPIDIEEIDLLPLGSRVTGAASIQETDTLPPLSVPRKDHLLPVMRM